MYACIFVNGDVNGDVNGVRTGVLEGLAGEFSPLVERRAENLYILDINGCGRIFGSPAELGKAIRDRALSGGLEVRVGIAWNPDSAVLAARGYQGVTVVPHGADGRACLGGLPVRELAFLLDGMDGRAVAGIFETLEAWGVRTVGGLAALPESGIAERLGEAGLQLRRLAGGRLNRPLVATTLPPEFKAGCELEHPLELLEQLLFVLGGLIGRVCNQLESRGFATNELRLQFRLEDGTVYERALNLPFPTRVPGVLLKLVHFDIEANPPSCAIAGVLIRAGPVKPRSMQNGLFVPLAPEPQKLELTLARLKKLVGTGNVGVAEVLDTHRPDSFRLNRFNPGGRRARLEQTGSESQKLLGFRYYRPPLPIRVEAPSEGGPSRVYSGGGRRNIRGKVVRATGPWKVSGEWWGSDYWLREEWDVAVGRPGQKSEALYRIFRDLRNGGWFVEGCYD